ncbi:hypothetical protein COTS27_00813 [Spirochaetota bacterium]|nr:hypothetical protein COTS27_00813 [Spirochaetota bacterium]
MAMNVKSFKNWFKKNWVKCLVIVVLLFLIGLLVANLSGEYCRPCFIKNLGITETNQLCNPGVLIVRLGYAIGGVIASLVAVAALERVRALDQGNIEDRYKNAITQFGNENSSVRLAGAYGLYYLARDNEDRRVNICNVLCVHIRGITTSEKPIFNRQKDLATTVGPIFDKESYSERYKTKPSDEVQSILDLLTNKENNKDFPFKSHWINLANAHLNGANLEKAQLQGANLRQAWLQGAKLGSAQLQEAYLWNAQLQGTNLNHAYLQEANLDYAQLQEAKLEKAQLQAATLQSAYLQGANLEEAQLQGANLRESHLQGANLRKSHLQGARLGFLQTTDSEKKQPQIILSNGVQLQGANLREAQLQGADLSCADFQGADLSYAQFQGANLMTARFQATNLYKAQLQLQSDEFAVINFNGAYADPNISIHIPPKTNLELAVDRLKNRSGKKADLKDVIFSGGVKADNLKNFKSCRTEIEKVLTGINYNDINNFKERMNRVEEILEENLGEPNNTPIPPGAEIEEYPKAEADKIIAMLEEVKKRLKKQQKFFKNL